MNVSTKFLMLEVVTLQTMFSSRLVDLRKSHNLTQRQTAKGIGLSEIGIQNYEGCRRRPTYDALIQIANFFNVSIDYLVGRTDNPAINR